jgi:tRNA threonylcarbamoyladenosine biosynthesis protein TsaE
VWYLAPNVPAVLVIQCVTRSVEDTHAMASAIAGLVRPRDLIVLSGDMGAGKTAFTLGFARALGVSEEDHVSSPTFTLMHTYASGRVPIHHADLYRLGSRAEVVDLGLREQADLGAVVLVEWGNVALEVLGDCLVVALETDADNDDMRHVTVTVEGHVWDTRWEQLNSALSRWAA